MQNRAKDLEGLLRIIHSSVAALNDARALLERYKDTESLITKSKIVEAHKDLSTAARDMVSGLVDLQEMPFDKKQHDLLFAEVDLMAGYRRGPLVEDEEIVLTDMADLHAAREDMFAFDRVPGDFVACKPPIDDDDDTMVLE